VKFWTKNEKFYIYIYSIDDVERKIEQGEVEMFEREGGGEAEDYEEEEEGGERNEWMREDGLEMDEKKEDEGKSIDDQQELLERISIKLESGIVNRDAEQTATQQLKVNYQLLLAFIGGF
jgi:hypothetical protein